MVDYTYAWIAEEVSSLTRYCGAAVQWMPLKSDRGLLFDKIEAPHKKIIESAQELAELKAQAGPLVVLLNGNTNYDFDIQATLLQLRSALVRGSRVILVTYNPYLRRIYQLANWLGVRRAEPPTTFLTRTSLASICRLSGYSVVRSRPAGYCPLPLGPLSDWINRVGSLLPLVRNLALAEVTTLRPEPRPQECRRPSLTVVVPARNERGNIEPLLTRLPQLQGCKLELIFVEGHSQDGTWEEIQRLIPLYKERFPIKSLQQTGKGKCDAVRVGFAEASGDLLTILDADLTMPPELLGRFYDAYCHGNGDFVNGNRLTYPMEGKAMRFLNRLGNVFFAKALSAVLEVPLGDSLCGTKLLSREDYQRICSWRQDFGDFDPFGDFELLFPAALLGLGVVDLPIRYGDRTYGETNISRFKHGWLLLKMTLTGLLRIRMAPSPGHSGLV